METGQLRSAEKAKELYPIAALDAFQNIYGVGPAKAKELTDQGFRSIQELRDTVKQNPKRPSNSVMIQLVDHKNRHDNNKIGTINSLCSIQ